METTVGLGSDERTYFFMHVMKTAGTSFSRYLLANFRGEQLYPRRFSDHRQAEYWGIDEVLSLPPEQVERIRAYHGHFPFFVADLVGADTTLTILRDPVDRIVSHINHCALHQRGCQGKSAEAIYDHPYFNPLYFSNYQVRQFAFTAEDAPEGHNDALVMDDGRLARACANLDTVTLFGLTSRYDEFLREVQARFGWSIEAGKPLQVTPRRLEVSDTLHRRIAEDNRFDLEFHAHAQQRYELEHPRP